MASGAILLQWRDRNWAEHGHYIYRSDTPMNPNNLPSPIGSVEQNITEYIDYDVIEGETYYYRIAAYRNNDVMVSDEIQLVAEPLNVGPGPYDFIGGDMSHGFFGEVSANDFITGDELASRIGLTGGTSFNSDTEWLKFALNDEIIFVPKKPHRHSISWDHINNAGAVYESQNTIVSIGGFDFLVTLLRGANQDPVPNTNGYDLDWTHGSEWNKLMYPIHSGIHTSSSNPSNPSEPYNQWASYSDTDLALASGNGRASWTQESRGSSRLYRGYSGVTFALLFPASGTLTYLGWRSALRLVR